jgi:hypothetical protein
MVSWRGRMVTSPGSGVDKSDFLNAREGYSGKVMFAILDIQCFSAQILLHFHIL